MAKEIIDEPSRTFMEYRFLTDLTEKDCVPENISFKTVVTRYTKEEGREKAKIKLNIPYVSAAMQSVTDARLAIAMTQEGGLGDIFCSQPIDEQRKMLEDVKNEKAGFVKARTLFLNQTVEDAFQKSKDDGHSIYPVVDESGFLKGFVNVNYLKGKRMDGMLSGVMREFVDDSLENIINLERKRKGTSAADLIRKVKEYIHYAYSDIDLKEANKIIEETNSKFIAIVNRDRKLDSLVFRKDLYEHLSHPNELIDENKRRVAAGAINTHDYTERVPELVKGGVDVLFVDASDGHTEWQRDCIKYCKSKFPHIPIIGGNIITAEGFNYLVEAGADGVKVGMGGGSICITQEEKGTGRGQATAVMKVAEARDLYYKENGIYIPIGSDGGMVKPYHILMAIAMGADYVMCGRLFAGAEESAAPLDTDDKRFKQYWGEGHARAKAWREKRYGQISFDEGVDGRVLRGGSVKDILDDAMNKKKSTAQSTGNKNIEDLQENARIERASEASLKEGQPHDIILKSDDLGTYSAKKWGLEH